MFGLNKYFVKVHTVWLVCCLFVEDALSEHRVAVKFGCQQIACRIGKTKLGANKSVRSLKNLKWQ